MKYAIFTSGGVFYCDHAPPESYPLKWWPADPDGVFMRHGASGVGGRMRLRMDGVVASVDLEGRVPYELRT